MRPWSVSDTGGSPALAMRDYLFGKGLAGASVRRLVGSIRTIINFAVAEHCLDINNPFDNVFIDIKVRQTKRQPIPLPVVRTIQDECLSISDEYRLLILVISGSLMRLSEAAGLMAADIKVVDGVMTASISPNQVRDLKTAASQRTVPLVGAARVGVERLLARSNGVYLFSKLVAGGYNRNSVSAAVNRWLKSRVPVGCSAHSFRHTGRDLLREASCPPPVIDAIGGWTGSNSAGESYGAGYSIKIMTDYLLIAMTTIADNNSV